MAKKAPHRGEDPRVQMLLRDTARLKQLLQKSTEKARLRFRQVEGLWQDLGTLQDMVRAYLKGEYRQIPLKTLAAAVSALFYFVNPWDLLPDPFLFGLVDDAMVVGMVLSSIKADLEKYYLWTNHRTADPRNS